MQRVIEIIDLLINTIDGQRVLDEIVGAYRQKVQTLGEGLGGEGRGWHFYHAAYFDVLLKAYFLLAELLLRELIKIDNLFQFAKAGEHGDQNAHLAINRGAQYGA